MHWNELQKAILEIFERRYPPKLREEYPRPNTDPFAIFSEEPTNDRNEIAYFRWAIHKLISECSERVFLVDVQGVPHDSPYQICISHRLPGMNGGESLYCQDFPDDAMGQYEILNELFPLPFVDIESGCVDLQTNQLQILNLGLDSVATQLGALAVDGCEIHFRTDPETGVENCLYPSPPASLPPLQDRKNSEHDEKIIEDIITLEHTGLTKRGIKEKLQKKYGIRLPDNVYRSLRAAASKKDPIVGRPGLSAAKR